MTPFDLDAARRVVPYIYLATPYSKYPDGLTAAWEAASACAGWLISEGARVYSPIAHLHPASIFSGLDPLDHSIWLPADEPFMRTSGALVVAMMPTWDQSKGIAHEIDLFERLGKPVMYLEWPRNSDTGVPIEHRRLEELPC